MSFKVQTKGLYSNEIGRWSYVIEYQHGKAPVELIHSDSGEERGTTDIQMKLMAILKALTYLRSIDAVEPITIKSDCLLCIQCIRKEFDCTSDDAFRRDKVTRGFVQYLQEIWWKIGNLSIQLDISE